MTSIHNTKKYTYLQYKMLKLKQNITGTKIQRKFDGRLLIDVYNEERAIWNRDGITINSPTSDKYKYYMNRYKQYVDCKDPISIMRYRSGFHVLRSVI